MLNDVLPYSHSYRRHLDIGVEPTTGPLGILADRQVLVLADLENLRYSAARLGFDVDLTSLGRTLVAASGSCAIHVCSTVMPELVNEAQVYLERCGWKAHIDPRERFRSSKPSRLVELEPKANANADHLLSFVAGCLVTRSKAEVIVLASGDGQLVNAIARRVHNLGRQRVAVTCSLPGSTSNLLDARRNPFIAGNIEIGRDCLQPFSTITERSHHAY